MVNCDCDLISPEEIPYLIATYLATKGDTNIKKGKKVPIQGIIAKVEYKDGKYAKSQIKELVKKGCIQRIRKKKMNYQCTRAGRNCAIRLMSSL